ncbi:MAG: VCBS repeat-containing protein [Planctomycetes bacterium]|nr:VCBS repeat-containing protein [Planctomycetota bacterium]
MNRRLLRIARSAPARHGDRRAARGALALALLLVACGDAGPSPSDGPRFVEFAGRAGLDVPLTCDGPVKDTILGVNGNGVALFDADGDGRLDVLLTDGSTRARWLAHDPVRLHLMLQTAPDPSGEPRFAEVADCGLVMDGWPSGVSVGDVDLDGRPDVAVGGLGEDALFLNRGAPGAPRFEKHALPGRTSPLDWTTSVAFGDADLDGRLDLLLVRYLSIDPADPPMGEIGGVPCTFKGHPVMCGPHGMTPQPDVLLRGVDAPELFVDASEACGLRSRPAAYGLGVVFADLDQDGDLDLYVANDSVDNHLWVNRGDGTFEERGSISGAASDMAGRAQAGMGVDLGDVDRDGDLDLVVTNFSDETNAFYRHDGGLLFRDMTTAAGLGGMSRPLLGWGVVTTDFDADGRDDLLFANGHVYPEADLPGTGTSYAQPIVLLERDAQGRFGGNVFDDPTPRKGRAVARGDLDDDGDPDLLVLVLDGAPLAYRNMTGRPERRLVVTLRGHGPGGREGYGATLRVRTAAGVDAVPCRSSSSFQAQGDARLFVTGTGPILEASVLWPGGEVLTLDPATLAFGRRVVVERGAGVVQSDDLRKSP